ncbi:MAG: STAS domain-containing protein [Rhizomicrobium sp.]|jgi:anti-anti-sigma factor
MDITNTQVEDTSIVKIEGDLLIGCVAQAKPKIVAALAAGDKVLLDLGNLGECDTAGIQLLLMARASARSQSKSLFVTANSTSFLTTLERVGIPADVFEYRNAGG